MLEQFSRTELVFGKEAMDKLKQSRVAVFGVGGVGGFAIEALARCGIETFDIFDNDTICLSNINRQIIATTKTIGDYKVDVMKQRIEEINPNAVVYTYKTFYLPEVADRYDFSKFDYIVDAIDTVTAKIELVVRANKSRVPIISSMGTGNKINPTKLVVTDIYKTTICPLAKVMRKELRERGIDKLKVIYSTEQPRRQFTESSENIENVENNDEYKVEESKNRPKRQIPGSTSFVPSVAGLIIASEVVKDIAGIY